MKGDEKFQSFVREELASLKNAVSLERQTRERDDGEIVDALVSCCHCRCHCSVLLVDVGVADQTLLLSPRIQTQRWPGVFFWEQHVVHNGGSIFATQESKNLSARTHRHRTIHSFDGRVAGWGFNRSAGFRQSMDVYLLL